MRVAAKCVHGRLQYKQGGNATYHSRELRSRPQRKRDLNLCLMHAIGHHLDN